MAELKTKRTNASVDQFLKKITDEEKRKDCYQILELMKWVTGEEPKMWGPSIIGFGTYHYKYASGREGDWFLTGFSPRKQNLSIYVMGILKEATPLLKKLGKHKIGGGCLYINKLEDVDLSVLKELVTKAVSTLKKEKK